MIMQTNIITIAAAVHTTYTVYADVLFLENLVMNFIIISAASMLTKKLFGEEASPLRRLIAAATGALYAVFTVILPSGAGKLLSSFFGKAVLSVLLVYIAFFPKKIYFMLKELLVFCFTGFVFAGTSIAVTYLGVPGTIVGNGFMITSLPSGYATIFLTVGIGYISLTLIVASLKRACINAESYVSLYIEFNGNGIWVPALVDTGNELRDPLTGTPVIIVESKAIQKYLSPKYPNIYFPAPQKIPEQART